MTAAGTARAARGAATVTRLLDATAGILRNEGAAAVSVQHVADSAGTSKGLVHYHFVGKDALLIACARRLTSQLVDDEGFALTGSTSSSALDDLWNVFSASEYRGRRRALLALSTTRSVGTAAALTESELCRREAAVATVARIEQLFNFRVPVSRVAIAVAFMAFADGIALSSSNRSDPIHRQAYDAFWLAVLSLTTS